MSTVTKQRFLNSSCIEELHGTQVLTIRAFIHLEQSVWNLLIFFQIMQLRIYPLNSMLNTENLGP